MTRITGDGPSARTREKLARASPLVARPFTFAMASDTAWPAREFGRLGHAPGRVKSGAPIPQRGLYEICIRAKAQEARLQNVGWYPRYRGGSVPVHRELVEPLARPPRNHAGCKWAPARSYQSGLPASKVTKHEASSTLAEVWRKRNALRFVNGICNLCRVDFYRGSTNSSSAISRTVYGSYQSLPSAGIEKRAA